MPRTKPTTTWSSRPKKDFLLQETFGKLLQEDGSGILLERSINTQWGSRTKPTTNWS